MKKPHVVILAGGTGSRFWPVSRKQKPKQFLPITPGGEALISATARRSLPLCGDENMWVVTNTSQKSLVNEFVPNAQILVEPVSRNTAASIGLAAVYIEAVDSEGVMLVLPSDHAVTDEEILRNTLLKATELASSMDVLVTIGIKPSEPQTAYGYIRRGGKANGHGYFVRRFYEKPNLERATEYFESDDYYWNSGMFAWKVNVILQAIEDELPQLHDGLMQIKASLGTKEEAQVTARVFEDLESISIDFGVLEHARNCAVIPAESFGWNDVGSWDAWAQFFQKDKEGNLIQGDVVCIDSQDCVVRADKKMVAILGGEALVVIESDDATLICTRDRVQDVRKIVDELKVRRRDDLI